MANPRSAGDQRYESVFATGPFQLEYERLTCLTEELDPSTVRRISALDPRDDWNCLELGAGTGTVARWMATRCSRGRVTAADIDLRFLADLREPNVDVVRHDLTSDDFPAGTFDLIHSRYVLVHLRDRDRVLARMASWLAPGGWLLIEEPAHFPVESAPDSTYRDVFLAHLELLGERAGTDANWSRRLPGMVGRLGLVDVGVDAVCSVVGAGRPMSRFFAYVMRHLAADLTARGQVTQGQVDRFVDLMDCPDFHELSVATIAAWGRRPV